MQNGKILVSANHDVSEGTKIRFLWSNRQLWFPCQEQKPNIYRNLGGQLDHERSVV